MQVNSTNMLQVEDRKRLRELLKKKRGYRAEITKRCGVYHTVIDGYFRGENNSQKVELAALTLADEVTTLLEEKDTLKERVFSKLDSHDTKRTS